MMRKIEVHYLNFTADMIIKAKEQGYVVTYATNSTARKKAESFDP